MIRDFILRYLPVGIFIVSMVLVWFTATILESFRWKRHIKKFLPQEATDKIEFLEEENRELKTALESAKDDIEHKELQLKTIRGGLEL